MVKKIKARYEGGKLIIPDGSEAPPDGSEVIVVFRTDGQAGEGDDELYGRWADKFPEGFDVEKELREIRSGWKKKLDDVVG